jgi:glycosyltransferase involved in cell wall biosynthesis
MSRQVNADVSHPDVLPSDTPSPSPTADPPLVATVGYLAPGIETMLHAMALLRTEHPDLRYEVVGHTHPDLVRRDGERYRWSLEALVDDLGLTGRVSLIDQAPAAARHVDLVARSAAVLVPYRAVEHAASRSIELALLGDRPLIVTRACVGRVPTIGRAVRWIDTDDDEACAAAVHAAVMNTAAPVV